MGDYSYYDDEGAGSNFEQGNVKYLYGPQKLLIGPSTFPFTMFGGTWSDKTLDVFMQIGQPGGTASGNDVWVGREVTILPGITIGDGAVIGPHSIVTKNVGPYEVVTGNPARLPHREMVELAR